MFLHERRGKIIDLTGLITESMWTFGPPLPEVRIRRVASLEKEGWDAHLLQMGNIQGTCLETAAHLLPNQPSIDQVPVQRFFAKGAVLQLPEKGPAEHITLSELEATGVDLEPGMAILLSTGWDRNWRASGFFWDSPHLTRDAMEWLASQKPSILGLDIPSSDDPREPEGLNKIIFAAGALLLAPLVNLRLIRSTYCDLIALPLLIKGVCGTPCRAVAIERE